MGHKVHPYGFRIGINKPWLAKWYADRDYATLLQEDMKIRALVSKQLANASVSQVEIERGINHVTVTVHSAKPGIVIGKGGANVELLRNSIGKLTDKKVKLEIKEVLQPELDATLVAQSIAGQLERRIAFRKAVKQGVQRTIKAGAKGVRIQVSGRLGGTEMSRREWYREGRVPLHTLRAKIDFGTAEAKTTFGQIGVKVWVYHGDEIPQAEQETERLRARALAQVSSGGASTGALITDETEVAEAAPEEPAATPESGEAPAAAATEPSPATEPAPAAETPSSAEVAEAPAEPEPPAEAAAEPTPETPSAGTDAPKDEEAQG